MRNHVKSRLVLCLVLASSWAAAKPSTNTAIPLKPLGPGFSTASDRAFRELIAKNSLARAYYLRAERNRLVTRADLRFLEFFEQSAVLVPLLNVVRLTQEERAARSRDGLTANARRVYSDSREFKLLYQTMIDLGLDMGLHPDDSGNILLFILSGDANAFAASGSLTQPIFGMTQGLLELLNDSASSRGEKRAVMAHEYGHVIAEHMHVYYLHKMMMSLLSDLFTESGTIPQTESPMLNEALRGVRAAAQANPRERGRLLAEYMNLAVKAMEEYLAPGEAIQYFKEDIIPKLNEIADGKRTSIALLHPAQFKLYTDMLNSAIERSHERSADQIASLSARNKLLATALVRLNGSERSFLAKADEIEEKLVGSRRQADEMRDWSRERLAKQNGGSHPPMNMRTDLILNSTPHPAVIFANPFTKLLVLYNYVCMESIALANWISHLEKSVSDDETSAQLVRSEQERFRDHLKTKEQIENVISGLVSAIDGGAKAHPRIRNLLEFALAEKELSLDKIAGLENQIAGARLAGRAEESQALQVRVNNIRRFNLAALDPLFDLAENALKTTASLNPIREARLKRISMARSAGSVESARAQRLSLFDESGDSLRGSRLPRDLVSSVNQSNYFVPNPAANNVPVSPKSDGNRTVFLNGPPMCDRILAGE